MYLNENHSDKLSFEAHQKTRERDYWLNKLSGDYEKSIFPYDWKRGGQERRMETVRFNLAGDIYSRLSMLSNNSDLRLYIVLAAAVVELLRRYSGSSDITVGSPIEKQETEGEFINTVLVIRNRLPEGLTFKGLLLQVSDTIIEANENVNYPLETLIYQLNRTFSRDDFPLFDVALMLSGLHDKKDIGHVPVNVIFSFTPAGRCLEGILEYNSALYRPETMGRISCHLVRLLEQVLADVNTKLSDIDILLPEEKKRLLVDFNDTVTGYPAERTLHELFAAEVEKAPDKTAVIGRKPVPADGAREKISYRELNRRANRLARLLRARGVRADTIVGIMLEPSAAMIVGILGILKAGGAYLPIDPGFPENRVISMLEDCRSSILVTGDDIVDSEFLTLEILPLDDLPVDDSSDADNINRSTDLAYVMFTSGSSGKPKGTLISHYNVVRLVKNTNYIEIEPGDRILQLSNFAFDGSVFGIFGALLNGAVLVMAEKREAFGLDELADLIEREQVTVFFVTTALFNALVDTCLGSLQGVRKILFGGERVSVEHTKKALEELGRGKIIHMYGPTESTVYATYYPVDGVDERLGTIPIGKPLANTTVYILDRRLQPVPLGVNGEIYIGGDGIAREYLHNPQLSAEKFLPVPDRLHRSYRSDRTYSLNFSKKIYKTGDLGRWLPDGNIEFVGRVDDQVKIRGFRIEPGEIENRLLLHEDVAEAVVAAGEAETGDKFLCAYVVPVSAEADGEQAAVVLKPAQLREYLSQYLPDYMIPSSFVMLETFPLNPNGKVDRKALPAPTAESSGKHDDYTPPRDEIEKRLAGIWSAVLGIEESKIGIDFDFFEIGGHSLKATTVISNIYKEMNVKVPLEEIFVTPTIRGLGEYVKKAGKESYTPLEAAPKSNYYPLSSQQKRLYFIHQVEPNSTVYNTSFVKTLEGTVDKEKLQDTFNRLINRHESLRTSFETVNGAPWQKVHDEVDFSIDYYDLAPGKGVGPGTLEDQVNEIVNGFVKPFDLERGPLFKIGLIKKEEGMNILMVDMHHIICDATSMRIMLRDFLLMLDDRELPGLLWQYRDYAVWQNSEEHKKVLKKQEEYWLRQLGGERPKLDLPTDYPRPEIQSYEGDTVEFHLAKEETRALRKMANEENVTMYMLLLAVYYVLLAKLTLREDIIIGTFVAGRGHPDISQIIGLFVNILALRNRPANHKTFIQFLKELKGNVLEAFANQDYQFEELVEKLSRTRDFSRNPLFDVLFNFISHGEVPGEGEVENHGFKIKTSLVDVLLTGVETMDRLSFTFEYCTRLFKETTIQKFIKYFKRIISAVLEFPGKKIADIELMSEEERNRLFAEIGSKEENGLAAGVREAGAGAEAGASFDFLE